jgi:hypothetical protein
MTFEEAKKILKKEGFCFKEATTKTSSVSESFTEYENPEICEAMQVVSSAGYLLMMEVSRFNERKARLAKELAEHSNAPVPGKEEGKEGNPALAESASQFNDALLDEQAKKIAELTKEKSNLENQITVLNACKKHNDKIDRKQIKGLGKEIARLNGIIHKKNLKIEELRKESSRHLRGKIKMFGENVDLEQMLKDKNAVLSDVAEELRLSKIREKNLVEVSQKYMKENEGLKEKLKTINKNRHNERIYKKQLDEKNEVIDELKKKIADKVVDKIDAQALKSAESALAYKEKVIAEKDEEIRALKLQISALEKRGNGIDWKRNAEAIKLYVSRASRERLWNPINQDICNEQELSFIINHGGKRVKYALRFDGTDIVYECSDPDKKPRIPTPEISVEELMKLQEKDCVDNAEEGKDLSGVIVLCGKDVVDALKKVKDVWQE